MKEQLKKLTSIFDKAIGAVRSVQELEALRVEFLGRKGKLAEAMKELADLSDKERKEAGVILNALKEKMLLRFESQKNSFEQKESSALAIKEWIDVTLPADAPSEGHLHVTSQTIAQIEDIFSHIGFMRSEAPDIDWDWYAFESLNIPKDHPARDNWETYFVEDHERSRMVDRGESKMGKIVLTPHTSNAQVRELEKGNLPIRLISIGRCYRRQSDVTHSPMFHQFEGFMVDKGISVTHLKGVLDYFAKAFFGPMRKTRLRPHHFRFTEPSFEVDISCGICDGTGVVNGVICRLCKSGWLELGGAGMTHPNVLKAGGIDPKKYTAFAFGWGVERTLMMRAGTRIDDIRVMYQNDLRFLNQF
ncbi:MAG: phenylalanine--tRNA ligase subunit alpha [Patescibacteria group bacterium]